jgi:hypothetical protein
MSNDDGGEATTTSSSVRRRRSRRGGAARNSDAGTETAFARLLAAGFGAFARGRLTWRFAAVAVRLTGAGRFAALVDRLAACRLAAFFRPPLAARLAVDFTGVLAMGGWVAFRRAGAGFFVDFFAAFRAPALVLAMMESFQNLDSVAISVVLSDAYRHSESRRVQVGHDPSRHS